MKIAVLGLGYVGLPISLQFARSCVSVLGIDVDPNKVELLNNGRSYIKHIEHSAIAELLASGTTDEELRAVLENGSGMKAGTDFHLAFSLEREAPSNIRVLLNLLARSIRACRSMSCTVSQMP